MERCNIVIIISILIVCWLSLVVVTGRTINDSTHDHDSHIPSYCRDVHFCFASYSENLQETVERVLVERNITALLKGDIPSTPWVHRLGDDSKTETEICDVTIHEMAEKPTFLLDIDDKFRIVVQGANFSQSIRMVECKKPGNITDSPVLAFMPEKNNFHCEQQYLQFKFLVMSEDMTGVEFVDSKFGVPVCCNCVYYDQHNM